jgi:acetylornithine deacetylase/succinyl-diaminopimelate desuccinylase family protein
VSDIATLLSRLVEIDSVNPDLVLGAAGEGEIARFVAGWLERAGLQVELQPTIDDRPNVIATVKGTGSGQSLMLNAHMDTVGYAGMERPLDPVIENNRLYGRGANDMKGSLAAMMFAGAALAQQPPAGDVILTAVVDEEYASIGTQAVVDRYRADAAIVTEETNLDVCIAHKGFVWIEIETRGVAAHGSRPHLGIDAIAKMGPIITGIAELDHRLRGNSGHPLLGPGSIHSSLVSGGTELSTYPDRCLLQVERRTIPGETAEQVDAEVAAMLEQVAEADPDFVGSSLVTLVRQPFEVAESEPIVRLVREQARKATGRNPELIGWVGWMDSALLSAAGIPTVIYGPGGEGSHATVEWACLDHLEILRDVLIATAREFCA